jgi:hypothetical protein
MMEAYRLTKQSLDGLNQVEEPDPVLGQNQVLSGFGQHC